jgi:hypothetical protein
VLAANTGLIVVKAVPTDGHDVHSVIDGFKAWEVDVGMELSYTGHYAILNPDLTGANVGRTGNAAETGIQYGSNTFDMVVNGAKISNFYNGIDLSRADTTGQIPASQDNYVFIDVATNKITNNAINNLDLTTDRVLTAAQLTTGPATLNINPLPVWDWTTHSLSLTGTKTDSLGTTNYVLGDESFTIGTGEMSGLLTQQGYYTTDDGRKIVILQEYYSDRATGEIFKTGIPIQIADNVPLVSTWWLPGGSAVSLGRIDLNAAAPITSPDSASTTEGKSVVINVLANDVDPNGLKMFVDGVTQTIQGTVKNNLDGTLTYTPENGFVGTETFKYWATDHNGKFTQQYVTVTVSPGDGTNVAGTTAAVGAVTSPAGTSNQAVSQNPQELPLSVSQNANGSNLQVQAGGGVGTANANFPNNQTVSQNQELPLPVSQNANGSNLQVQAGGSVGTANPNSSNNETALASSVGATIEPNAPNPQPTADSAVPPFGHIASINQTPRIPESFLGQQLLASDNAIGDNPQVTDSMHHASIALFRQYAAAGFLGNEGAGTIATGSSPEMATTNGWLLSSPHQNRSA